MVRLDKSAKCETLNDVMTTHKPTLNYHCIAKSQVETGGVQRDGLH